jgi:hypothetical protein
MIVPEYWVRARGQGRSGRRQVTVHRYGWSDTSLVDATKMAETRVDEALQQILAGARLERRESLGVYNGADGVPIREEVVSRSGASVISRNSYGARCLNTPDVLFADIDFEEPAAANVSLGFFVCLLAVIVGGVLFGVSVKWLFLGMVGMLIFRLWSGR